MVIVLASLIVSRNKGCLVGGEAAGLAPHSDESRPSHLAHDVAVSVAIMGCRGSGSQNSVKSIDYSKLELSLNSV